MENGCIRSYENWQWDTLWKTNSLLLKMAKNDTWFSFQGCWFSIAMLVYQWVYHPISSNSSVYKQYIYSMNIFPMNIPWNQSINVNPLWLYDHLFLDLHTTWFPGPFFHPSLRALTSGDACGSLTVDREWVNWSQGMFEYHRKMVL